MTAPADDLDVAVDALHGDKKKVLTGQLRSIEEEVVERRLISADTALQVHDEVSELNLTMRKLTPEHEHAPDVARKERMIVEHDKMMLTKELREEQRDSWKAVQELKREERTVEKELLGEEQRHKRTKDLL